MSLFFKTNSLAEVLYLLIRFKKTKHFLENNNKTMKKLLKTIDFFIIFDY